MVTKNDPIIRSRINLTNEVYDPADAIQIMVLATVIYDNLNTRLPLDDFSEQYRELTYEHAKFLHNLYLMGAEITELIPVFSDSLSKINTKDDRPVECVTFGKIETKKNNMVYYPMYENPHTSPLFIALKFLKKQDNYFLH